MFRDPVLSGLTNGHGGASSPVVRGVAGRRQPYIASRVKKSLESVAATGSTITLGAVGAYALRHVLRQHGGSRTSEKPQVVGVAGGAVGLSALALAFGVCCVAPWAVTIARFLDASV